jgi:hypothetical protein
MRKAIGLLSVFPLVWLLAGVSLGQETPSGATKVRLDSATRLELTNADVRWMGYRGRQALKLVPLAGH